MGIDKKVQKNHTSKVLIFTNVVYHLYIPHRHNTFSACTYD